MTEDHHCSPEGVVGDACQTQTVPYDELWMHTFYDDYHWEEAVLFTEEEVGQNGKSVYDKDLLVFRLVLTPDLHNQGMAF